MLLSLKNGFSVFTPSCRRHSTVKPRSLRNKINVFQFNRGKHVFNSVDRTSAYDIVEDSNCDGWPNWDVGGAERIWKWGGGTGPEQSAGKIFWSCPSTFLALKAQLVVLVSAFVMVSTVWSVSCLLFYSRCPACPAICKSGGTCPHRAPWSRRHWRPELLRLHASVGEIFWSLAHKTVTVRGTLKIRVVKMRERKFIFRLSYLPNGHHFRVEFVYLSDCT